MLQFENEFWAQGFKLIAGVDEAGRGPLAGPVAAGAVILITPPLAKGGNRVSGGGYVIPGVNDSKKLTEKMREKLYAQITENAVSFSVQMCDEKVIDEINILEASKLAMTRAINALNPTPDAVLTDFVKLKISLPQKNITHGDALSYSIAAASILAKVERDRLMLKYHEIYPEYGFDRHKGYGTRAHIEAIKKYGLSPIHRKSFCGKIIL